ncbi:MAG: hypothetical protein K2N44_16330, partial [Lachnospiraceae bacterium]|nr:hypothetical protein [Lachnospiraceae bacterium]
KEGHFQTIDWYACQSTRRGISLKEGHFQTIDWYACQSTRRGISLKEGRFKLLIGMRAKARGKV